MNLHRLLTGCMITVALTGCTGGGGLPVSTPVPTAPAATTSAASGPSEPGAAPSGSGSPSPSSSSPTPSAPPLTATIPTDCRALVPAEKYDAIFQGTPLNDPDWVDPAYAGAVEPIQSVPGAPAEQILSDATRLRCMWHDPQADITGLSVDVARVDPAVADVHLDEREVAGGYTCQTIHDGRRCQLIRQNEHFPVEEAATLFSRGDIYIWVYQANFPTDDLLGDLVASIWN